MGLYLFVYKRVLLNYQKFLEENYRSQTWVFSLHLKPLVLIGFYRFVFVRIVRMRSSGEALVGCFAQTLYSRFIRNVMYNTFYLK